MLLKQFSTNSKALILMEVEMLRCNTSQGSFGIEIIKMHYAYIIQYLSYIPLQRRSKQNVSEAEGNERSGSLHYRAYEGSTAIIAIATRAPITVFKRFTSSFVSQGMSS